MSLSLPDISIKALKTEANSSTERLKAGKMEKDSLPIFDPVHFINTELIREVKEPRQSYNWILTVDGWNKMDKETGQLVSTPPKLMPLALEFGGQWYDEDENIWTQCFEIEKDGTIDSKDTYFHKVRSTVGDAEIDLDEVCLTAAFWLNHILLSLLKTNRLWT